MAEGKTKFKNYLLKTTKTMLFIHLLTSSWRNIEKRLILGWAFDFFRGFLGLFLSISSSKNMLKMNFRVVCKDLDIKIFASAQP